MPVYNGSVARVSVRDKARSMNTVADRSRKKKHKRRSESPVARAVRKS